MRKRWQRDLFFQQTVRQTVPSTCHICHSSEYKYLQTGVTRVLLYINPQCFAASSPAGRAVVKLLIECSSFVVVFVCVEQKRIRQRTIVERSTLRSVPYVRQCLRLMTALKDVLCCKLPPLGFVDQKKVANIWRGGEGARVRKRTQRKGWTNDWGRIGSERGREKGGRNKKGWDWYEEENRWNWR